MQDYRYELMDVKGAKVPRLIIGTSPFIGAGQFGPKSMYYYQQFYENPVNITNLFAESIERGINAIHTPFDHKLMRAILMADRTTDSNSFIMATIEQGNLQAQLNLCSSNTEAILLHGSYTDPFVDKVDELLARVKSKCPKALTGIATHTPGSIIPKIIGKPHVEVILAPVNNLGLFMDPSPDSTLKAVKEARANGVIVFAMKPLAAGRLNPENAIKYLKNRVDGVVIGVTSSKELKEIVKVAEIYYS